VCCLTTSTRRLGILTRYPGLIQATKQKDHLVALKELVKALKDSLQYGRGKLGLEALGNKTYLDLCKAIFAFIHTTLQSKAQAPKVASQLNLTISALRHVVPAGVRTIKNSTVEFIVDNIIAVFSDERGRKLAPLIKDVPEALRILYEYQPHAERLSKDRWNLVVAFCIEFSHINPAVPEAEPSNTCDTSVSSRGRTPFDSTDASGTRASPYESRDRSKPVSDGFSRSTDHLISCLHALVKASNAPLLDKAESIVTALLNFLQNRVGRNKTAVTALAAINAILSRVVVQSLELTKYIIQRLLPLMTEMWSDPAIRDELLITLTYTEPSISSLLADREDELAHLDVEALMEVIYGDYRSRKDITVRQYLEEDNLCFRHLGRANTDTHPLNTYVFSMATEHLPSEGVWATVSTIARFSSMLDKRRRVTSSNREGNNGIMKKRVRVTRLFDEYLRHVAEPRPNAKRAALQVVAFLVQEEPVNVDDLQSILEKLTSCISDENAVHSVWALIGLAA
jgi:ataxia telangiectasia mutated family protein